MELERKLFISKHLLQRYIERFMKGNEQRKAQKSLNMSKWHRTFQQKKLLRELKSDISKLFNSCKETRSYLNNSTALGYLMERYSWYDSKQSNYKFFHNYHILYVTEFVDGVYQGITCYDLKEGKHMFKNVSHKKFKKKNKDMS